MLLLHRKQKIAKAWKTPNFVFSKRTIENCNLCLPQDFAQSLLEPWLYTHWATHWYSKIGHCTYQTPWFPSSCPTFLYFPDYLFELWKLDWDLHNPDIMGLLSGIVPMSQGWPFAIVMFMTWHFAPSCINLCAINDPRALFIVFWLHSSVYKMKFVQWCIPFLILNKKSNKKSPK